MNAVGATAKDIWRFFDKVEDTPTCWLWTAYRDPRGYGRFGFREKVILAHTFPKMLIDGPCPPGLEHDHLCCNTACVNPSHIERVTLQENMRRRGVNRTHCLHGHCYEPDNAYWRLRAGKWTKECRTCRKNRSRRLTGAVAS